MKLKHLLPRLSRAETQLRLDFFFLMEIIPNELGEGVCLMEQKDEKVFG